jgi:hypothetical protein
MFSAPGMTGGPGPDHMLPLGTPNQSPNLPPPSTRLATADFVLRRAWNASDLRKGRGRAARQPRSLGGCSLSRPSGPGAPSVRVPVFQPSAGRSCTWPVHTPPHTPPAAPQWDIRPSFCQQGHSTPPQCAGGKLHLAGPTSLCVWQTRARRTRSLSNSLSSAIQQ